jgi:hypothetical protein
MPISSTAVQPPTPAVQHPPAKPFAPAAPQHPKQPPQPAVNHAVESATSFLQQAIQPVHQAAPAVASQAVQRNAAHQAIIKRKGQYYEPMHGWDGDLPRYSLECRAAGYPCIGPGGSYLDHIHNHYDQFRVMYQKVEHGYMAI